MPAQANQLRLARDEFKQYMRKNVDVARTLRDELKVQAHLGTAEAKSRWTEIEKRLSHGDALAHELNHVAGEFMDRLIEAVRDAAAKKGAKRWAKRRVAKARGRA